MCHGQVTWSIFQKWGLPIPPWMEFDKPMIRNLTWWWDSHTLPTYIYIPLVWLRDLSKMRIFYEEHVYPTGPNLGGLNQSWHTSGIYFAAWWFRTWFVVFSIWYWEFHTPNWRTPSFFRGVGWNHQPVYIYIRITWYQWPFQDPKLEIPTIYKAYVRPM